MDENKKIFLSLIDDYTDFGINQFFFPVDSKLIFADLGKSLADHPEISLLVENLEFCTGYRVLLSFESGDEIDEFYDNYDEMVIFTIVMPDDSEQLWYIVTPLGTFYFSFFDLESGRVVEISEVPLTEKMKTDLFLVPCEADFSDDDFEVKFVYDTMLPFPPKPPEYYLTGSKQERQAIIYKQFREKQALSEENAETVYSTECGDFIDQDLAYVDSQDTFMCRSYIIRPD